MRRSATRTFRPEIPGDFSVRKGGASATVRVRPSVHATNGELLRELALAGGGIILQPTFIVGRDLMRGSLIALLPEWKLLDYSLYAVYLSQRQLATKVRVFIDYLLESIGEEPYWERSVGLHSRRLRRGGELR